MSLLKLHHPLNLSQMRNFRNDIHMACLAALMTFLCGPLRSQSLDSLLGLLEVRNPELAMYATQSGIADQEILAAGQLPATEFGLGMFALPVETRLGPQWIRLSAGQAFPWPGTLAARQEAAKRMTPLIPLQARIKARELSLQLTEAWLDWYRLGQEAIIRTEQIELLESLESRLLAAVTSGQEGMEQVLELRMEIDKLNLEATLAETRRKASRAIINALLQRPPDEPLTLRDTLRFLSLPAQTDTTLFFQAASYPGFELLRAKTAASEARTDMLELQGKPSFSVGLDYILVGRRTDAEPAGNGRDILGPRLGIKWPVSQRQTDAFKQQEHLRRDNIRLEGTALEQTLFRETAKALALWEEASLSYNFVSDQLKLLESVRSILEARYSSGNSDFERLIKNYTKEMDIDLILLNAIVNSHRANARMRLWLGSTAEQ